MILIQIIRQAPEQIHLEPSNLTGPCYGGHTDEMGFPSTCCPAVQDLRGAGVKGTGLHILEGEVKFRAHNSIFPQFVHSLQHGDQIAHGEEASVCWVVGAEDLMVQIIDILLVGVGHRRVSSS